MTAIREWVPPRWWHNESEKKFVLEVEGREAFIEYSLHHNVISLLHTEVPAALEGMGYGRQLVQQSLEEIARLGYRIIPLCPFVAAYIQRNPAWKSFLAEGYAQ